MGFTTEQIQNVESVCAQLHEEILQRETRLQPYVDYVQSESVKIETLRVKLSTAEQELSRMKINRESATAGRFWRANCTNRRCRFGKNDYFKTKEEARAHANTHQVIVKKNPDGKVLNAPHRVKLEGVIKWS